MSFPEVQGLVFGNFGKASEAVQPGVPEGVHEGPQAVFKVYPRVPQVHFGEPQVQLGDPRVQTGQPWVRLG